MHTPTTEPKPVQGDVYGGDDLSGRQRSLAIPAGEECEKHRHVKGTKENKAYGCYGKDHSLCAHAHHRVWARPGNVYGGDDLSGRQRSLAVSEWDDPEPQTVEKHVRGKKQRTKGASVKAKTRHGRGGGGGHA